MFSIYYSAHKTALQILLHDTLDPMNVCSAEYNRNSTTPYVVKTINTHSLCLLCCGFYYQCEICNTLNITIFKKIDVCFKSFYSLTTQNATWYGMGNVFVRKNHPYFSLMENVCFLCYLLIVSYFTL